MYDTCVILEGSPRKKHILGGSPPASAEVGMTMVPAKKKRKLNDNYDILFTDAPGDNEEVGRLYPHLCSALGLDDGFDPTSPSIQKSMVGLLTEIHCYFSNEFELVIRGYGNKNIHYIRVPQTSSNDSFRNSKEWLDVAIRVSESKEGSTFNSAYHITNHLFCFYKDSVLAACKKQKVAVCKLMTSTEFAAMIKAAKNNGTGEREVRSTCKRILSNPTKH